MTESIPDNRKKRGRPRVGSTLVGVRLEPDLLAHLDAYRATLPDEPSRPEAIRSMIEAILRIIEKDPDYLDKD
ncbi:hypothetical protein [Paenirhodobacter populi]|uniref:Ribbon-helix-helix protein, CopG family n=1 Tax=Paenirhodobacter populi TaxID=2306993 RepID=A0A443IPQ2_9RHOB|nr:hypothetical protein [Sinirhodobacter populi]RWR08501.1 hypothetical protein D2T33_15510 [Sinirhodobacter populi]